MIKQAQPKSVRPAAKKGSTVIRGNGGKITAFLSHADDVVERTVNKALASSSTRQYLTLKVRSSRAPHLLTVERELNELKKVVEALAVRSVAKDRSEYSFDEEAMLVLDAETVYQLLDSPPEPTETLCSILALR